MINRQQILIGVFVTGLVSYLGYWGYDSLIAQRLESKTKAVERARKTATGRKKELIESRAAKLELEKWRKLSLPADPNAATPQYQAFLLDLLEQSGFERPTINPGSPSLREKTYWRIPFEVHTRGSMESLVTFLDAFYRIQLLHKLSGLSLTPIELNQREALELRFTVEALALVSESGSQAARNYVAGLANASRPGEAEPVGNVLDRNLLMRQGPGPAGRPTFQATQVYLTGTIVSAKQPEALLYNRATGESLTWHLGDQVAAGDVRGEVVDITTTEIALDLDGQWYTVALGDHLGSRRPLSPEAAITREVRRARGSSAVQAN
jgi:Tfp pilus assembly protein PilO